MNELRRSVGVLALLLVLPPPVAEAQCIPAWLSFSASEERSDLRLEPFQGTKEVYVWFPNYLWDEMEFGIETSFEVVGTSPAPGVTNLGTKTEPHLVFDAGCDSWANTYDPVFTVTVRDPDGVGGYICPRESAGGERLCARIRGEPWIRVSFSGLDTTGDGCYGDALSAGCENLTPVVPSSWGAMKAHYLAN
ncbi:hypothetical protein K8I85_05085 [bacterium]|nr:hypothetical protein [bacterium]